MTDEVVSRRRENSAFFLRILAFGLIFTLISCAVLYVLTPKYDYGPGSMMNLPLQPRNTIDVLAVGTSTTYAAVNTNVLWANWGFSVYDLASAEQQYWHTYYYLEQALTTQHPKILLLDAKAATYPDDTTRRGRTILSTSGILNPIRRANAIAAGGQQPLDFLLGYPLEVTDGGEFRVSRLDGRTQCRLERLHRMRQDGASHEANVLLDRDGQEN